MVRWVLSALLAAGLVMAERPAPRLARAAERKFQLIQSDTAAPGSRIRIDQKELNAFARQEVARVAPQGVRDPRLVLGTNRATGFAYVDFPKLRRAQGKPMGWLMSKLLAGERPVRVDARIRSARGRAVVDLERVQVSGITLSGGALDYLVRNFLWSYYPDAKVGRPFHLAHNIDRLEVRPEEVDVVIGR